MFRSLGLINRMNLSALGHPKLQFHSGSVPRKSNRLCNPQAEPLSSPFSEAFGILVCDDTFAGPHVGHVGSGKTLHSKREVCGTARTIQSISGVERRLLAVPDVDHDCKGSKDLGAGTGVERPDLNLARGRAHAFDFAVNLDDVTGHHWRFEIELAEQLRDEDRATRRPC